MGFSSVNKALREYLTIWRDLFLRYSTLDKKNNFTKSIAWAVASLGLAVAGFQSFLRSPDLSKSGLAVLSVVSIIIFPLLINRYTAKSAERTTETEFHTKKRSIQGNSNLPAYRDHCSSTGLRYWSSHNI